MRSLACAETKLILERHLVGIPGAVPVGLFGGAAPTPPVLFCFFVVLVFRRKVGGLQKAQRELAPLGGGEDRAGILFDPVPARELDIVNGISGLASVPLLAPGG